MQVLPQDEVILVDFEVDLTSPDRIITQLCCCSLSFYEVCTFIHSFIHSPLLTSAYASPAHTRSFGPNINIFYFRPPLPPVDFLCIKWTQAILNSGPVQGLRLNGIGDKVGHALMPLLFSSGLSGLGKGGPDLLAALYPRPTGNLCVLIV